MDIEKLMQIEKKIFLGWDFDKINKKTVSEVYPWDYKEIVKKYLSHDDTLLDMGTGGGEFLLSLGHPHHLTTVTESYPPNINLCKERLVPLGISLHENKLGESSIPNDSHFSLIINRHDAYDPQEVYEGLKGGGYFITQQVGGLNNQFLSQKLLGYPYKDFSQNDWTLDTALSALSDAGFKIEYADECIGKVKYFDLETIVAYASIIEWEFPGFSVEKNEKQLKQIEKELKAKGYVEGQEHRFIIVAKKM